MPPPVDLAPYGSHPPRGFARMMLALTRRLPPHWLGLRTSMPLRRMAIDWLGEEPVDTTVWNARVRLYPSRNSCEKNALFTPQMLGVIERGELADALDRRLAEAGGFTFVDIGANVGLYSLFVAARGGPRTRILAIEPQPGIVERLPFNLEANAGFEFTVLPIAVADREGEIDLVIDPRDSGGTHLGVGRPAASGAETVCVRCRPLLAILREAGIAAIDAMKIDIEGAEDLALAPFLEAAPQALLPRLLLIEVRPADWRVDLSALLRRRGYIIATRSRHNAVWRLA